MRGDPEAMPAKAAAGRQPPEANLFIIKAFQSPVKPARWGGRQDHGPLALRAGVQPSFADSVIDLP
jgi:hypothetical protein